MFTQCTSRDILRLGGEIMSINERLKDVRLTLDLSQERFGQPLGLTKTSVSASENGNRVVSDRTVLLLRASYSVNPKWMYTGEGEMFLNDGGDFVSEMAAKYQLTDFQQTLVRAVYEMPPELQRMAVEVARKIAADSYKNAEIDETEHEQIERVTNQYLDAHEAQHAITKVD